MRAHETNKEFYEDLLRYEKEGKVLFMPRTIPYEHFKVHVGKKTLTVHISLVDFGREILDKVESHDFFSENLIESYLGKSITYVNKMVEQGEYIRIVRGKGLKFYVKKDWE